MQKTKQLRLITITIILFSGMVSCDENSESNVDATEAVEKPNDERADSFGGLCEEVVLPAGCDICNVYGWYNDGECDTFCATPDIDCESEPEGPRHDFCDEDNRPEYTSVTCDWSTITMLGNTSASLYLNRVGEQRDYDVDDYENEIMSFTEVDQIMVAVDKLGYMGDNFTCVEAFDVPDEGIFYFIHAIIDGISFDYVWFYSGDTEVGVVFEVETLNIVAEVGDGDVLGCVPVVEQSN